MKEWMMSDVVSHIQAALLGVAIGDAMGMPWEMMTHAEIMAATKGEGVTGFSNPVQRKLKGTMNLVAGDTTDDWQLTAANARSLIRCGYYDHRDCAMEHVKELRRTRFGWGRTTRTSVEKIESLLYRHVDSGGHVNTITIPEAKLVSPGKTGAGCGNGVAMKIAPIALFRYLQDGRIDPEHLWEEVRLHGTMTHPDIRASIAAFALALTLQIAIDPQRRIGMSALSYLRRECKKIETNEGCESHTSHISDIFASIDRNDLLDNQIRLRESVGTSCFSLESVPFAIATFLRHPHDFRGGVLEAITAGGDTDSTASMVGALVGANCGLEAIPTEWKTFRPTYEEALDLGAALFDAGVIKTC